jgi:hypothetical protein
MEDSFYLYYSKKYKFLADLNLEIIYKAMKILQINKEISLSESYSQQIPSLDYRETIHPKRKFAHSDYNFHPVVYHQVFSDRHGFIPDLSIMDLLFNEGPNAGLILKESISKNKT